MDVIYTAQLRGALISAIAGECEDSDDDWAAWHRQIVAITELPLGLHFDRAEINSDDEYAAPNVRSVWETVTFFGLEHVDGNWQPDHVETP